jgi:hypothetical protein
LKGCGGRRIYLGSTVIKAIKNPKVLETRVSRTFGFKRVTRFERATFTLAR